MTTPPRATLINPMTRHLDAIGGPIRIARAEGVRLYDDTGRSWIDCETGTGVFSLGHRHPAVMERLEHAITRFDLGNHHLISGERAILASYLDTELTLGFGTILLNQLDTYHRTGWTEERVSSLTDYTDRMRCVFNVSSSEAIDCGIKLARGATGRSTIICADNAYHGSTGYALAASASLLSANVPTPPPGFVHVPYGPVDAIAHELEKNTDVAAVLLEPIAVEAGCVVPPNGYLRNTYQLCRERNVPLILDESVTGLGRTGSVLACAQQWTIPDILVIGRAMGGGIYPMHATCYRKEHKELDAFYTRNPFVHISTFGGGEVGCMVTRLALSELSEEWLLENVCARGTEFRHAVTTLLGRGDTPLRSVRGVGLANAIELCDVCAAQSLQRSLFDRGVLCRAALLSPQTLLFLPPLTITADEMAAVTAAIESSVLAAPEVS